MKKGAAALTVIAPALFLVVSVFVVCMVSQSGQYPMGSDVMYHIYRGTWLYDSILDGNYWPLLNLMWYNGVELLRYWAPLPAYFMAFCIAVSGGDTFNGYLIFVGLICFLGALSWSYIGFQRKRPVMGTFLGILWFFMPNNLYAMFREGNLARCVSMIFLPLLFYGIYAYLEFPNTKRLVLISISFLGICMCHLGYGGMVALSVLLYLCVNKVITRQRGAAINIVIAVLLPFFMMGVWLVPSLVGGITAMDSSETMATFFQSAWYSLNPFERYNSNNMQFYFGAAALLLAVFGGIFSGKKQMPGFWTAVLIFLCTTTAMYPVMAALPGGQYLWMLRFISIALCMILMSWMFWTSLRRPLMILFALLLLVDIIPSLSLAFGADVTDVLSVYHKIVTIGVEERQNQTHEYELIDKAQEITNQRIALVDFSEMENAAWHISAYGDPKPCTNGAGWEGANTGANISQLERAVLEERYLYLFDRCLQLGGDTVVILAKRIADGEKTLEQVDAEAAAVGYHYVESNAWARIYHIDIPGTWGTVSKYRGLAIGDVSVTGICRSFPALKEADSTNLNDYTFEEISEYDIIYLSSFTYSDQEAAEDLVLRLSEAGVHIVIAADGIPENRDTHNQSFLGAICNPISFSNGYPEMDTIDGQLNTDLFPQGYTEWDTVYVVGLDECWGTIWENDVSLDFYGTVKNDNIVVIGLNLTRFLALTQDQAVERLLSHAMDLSPEELPQRTIVPLEIESDNRSLTITAPEDAVNVNTALAYHDIFKSDRELRSENNLLVVDGGTTVIELEYPHFWAGLAVSAVGLLLTLAYWISMHKRLKLEAAAPREGPKGIVYETERADRKAPVSPGGNSLLPK